MIVLGRLSDTFQDIDAAQANDQLVALQQFVSLAQLCASQNAIRILLRAAYLLECQGKTDEYSEASDGLTDCLAEVVLELGSVLLVGYAAGDASNLPNRNKPPSDSEDRDNRRHRPIGCHEFDHIV